MIDTGRNRKLILKSTPVLTLVIALIYALVSKISFLVGLHPDNILAVFPAAGFAITVVVLVET